MAPGQERRAPRRRMATFGGRVLVACDLSFECTTVRRFVVLGHLQRSDWEGEAVCACPWLIAGLGWSVGLWSNGRIERKAGNDAWVPQSAKHEHRPLPPSFPPISACVWFSVCLASRLSAGGCVRSCEGICWP